MKKVYKDRLLKLADFLYNHVSTKNFDLATFTSYETDSLGYCPYTIHKRSYDIDPEKLFKGLKNKDCGTTACALGWSPVVFKRQLTYDDYGNPVVRANGDSASEFFGCNEIMFDYLFQKSSYQPGHNGPKSVANRIRKFVKDGKIPKRFRDEEENESVW